MELLCEALCDLTGVEAEHGLVRVGLLNSHLNECFFRVCIVSHDGFKDLDSFELLVSLETNLSSVLLQAAPGEHLKNGLTAFFGKQTLRV